MEGNIARLSGPAARLLLVLLLARSRGETKIKAGEMRRAAGLPNSRIFGEAREQLARFGFATLEKRGQFYVINAFALNGSGKDETERKIDGESVEIDNLSIYHTTDAEAGERDEPELFLPRPGMKKVPGGPKLKNGPIGTNFLEDELENVLRGPNSQKNGPIGTNSKMDSWVQFPENGPIGTNSQENVPGSTNSLRGKMLEIMGDAPNELGVTDAKSKCVEVDRMDDSGDISRSGTPAQIRRRQQIAVLQEAWKQFFPAAGPLMAENAKAFLRGREESAESVYDLFELVASKNPGSPLAYAKAVMRKSEQATPTAPTSTAFVPGPASSPEPDPVEQDRLERAAHAARIKHWRRFNPDGELPADL